MKRRLAISTAAIFSALAFALYLWRIEPLLPERGSTTCFIADYAPPRLIDLSSPRRDQKSVGEVSSTRVEIHLDSDEEPFRNGAGGGYEWRYSLRLHARLANGERLSSAAICEWSAGIDRIMPALFCYIDCDGGSVTVWREFGRKALTARFEPGERLKTGGSCGEGRPLFMGAEREARSLPVEQTSAHFCTE